MDKHLLAKNPMRSPKGGLCIIRTVIPIAIFEIKEGHRSNKEHRQLFSCKNRKGILEPYTLELFHYFATDEANPTPKNVQKYMKDAIFWYKAYIKNKIQSIRE